MTIPTTEMVLAARAAARKYSRDTLLPGAVTEEMLKAALALLPAEPHVYGWFVKDFADGWIFFDKKADADREISGTGAMMLAGISAPEQQPDFTHELAHQQRELVEENGKLRVAVKQAAICLGEAAKIFKGTDLPSLGAIYEMAADNALAALKGDQV